MLLSRHATYYRIVGGRRRKHAEMEARARRIAGDAVSDENVVRFSHDGRTVAFLEFPEFETAPQKIVLGGVIVDVVAGGVRRLTLRGSDSHDIAGVWREIGEPEIADEIESASIRLNPRPTCLDCVRKHLAQAEVLMSEARQGYPDHAWLAIGHMAEAADEALKECPELAREIRAERLKYMSDHSYDVPIMELIQKCDRKALDAPREYAVASNPRKRPDRKGWPKGAIPIEDLPAKVRNHPSFQAAQDAMIARYGKAPTFAIPVDAPRGASPVLASIGELKRIDYLAADSDGEPIVHWMHEGGDRGEGEKPTRPQIVTYDPEDDKILLVNPPGADATFNERGIVG